MVHVSAVRRVPEKWLFHWKEATVGRGRLLLFDYLVAELFEKLTKEFGAKFAEQRLWWLKSLPNTYEVEVDNNLACATARALLKFRKYDVSLTDAFILAIAEREGAVVFTTDEGLRNACRDSQVEVSYLPRAACK
jgi:predicted nucleic acid-binding protein